MDPALIVVIVPAAAALGICGGYALGTMILKRLRERALERYDDELDARSR